MISSLGITPNTMADTATLERRVDQLEQRLDITADAIQGTRADNEETSIGGYGEMHYNSLNNDGPDGDKKQIDFHRFVLFFGHEFTDSMRFFSEVELEHSIVADDKEGEMELEQAFIDFDLADRHTARAGLFLLPVGIINETHEPPTFYGVERNPVETRIIPATWWEGGAALYGELAEGWHYDLAITSGLNDASYNIRSGRQKVSEAQADDLAYTGRIKWTGAAGVEVAATVQKQDNITQGSDPDASATLIETHGIVNRGPVTVKVLYAIWDVDGNGAKTTGADEQTGWYIEPSYRISPRLGVFARLNQWDNAAGDSADSEYTQVDAGFNYWPHQDIVLKLDYQTQDAPAGANEYKGVNLGVGYQF